MRNEQYILSQVDNALDYFFEQTISAIDEFWFAEEEKGHIMRVYLEELWKEKNPKQRELFVMSRLFSLADDKGKFYLPFSYYSVPYDLPWRGATWDTIEYDNPFEMQVTIAGAYISSFFNDFFSSKLENGIVGCAIDKIFPSGCEMDNSEIEVLIDFRTHGDFICECISKSKILALKSISKMNIDICLQY